MCARPDKPFLIHPARGLKGKVSLSGDKSIAHRCIILSSISKGQTLIDNFPVNKDCLSTLAAFKKLGIKIKRQGTKVWVFGKGLSGLKKPSSPIFVGDSGTTMRLLLGVLAGQNLSVRLTCGKSLSQRPMLRVTAPLRMMGAKIREEYPPITIKGGNLKAITYKMPVASAQVKSAILLAGLYTKGLTRIIEPVATRDHTERLLKLFKAEIKVKVNKIVIKGGRELVSPRKIYVPQDISSASFFIVAAAIIPNSQILIKKVSLNPSRIGIIRVLKRMGADIQLSKWQSVKMSKFEPMGNIIVKSSSLRATVIKKEEIPSLIDELPVLMVAASLAQGKTILEDIGELRVKETDRIRSMSENLAKMGAKIKVIRSAKSENIVIQSVKELKGACVKSFGDHRTAMSMVVAGLIAKGSTHIDDISCISKSFPDFLDILHSVNK